MKIADDAKYEIEKARKEARGGSPMRRSDEKDK